jgi:HSP90 family molecular chaperone
MPSTLTMRFDRKTIDHLGIKLYSSFPPIIAELISNSYDADAEEVTVAIDYTNKVIAVTDNGNGMTHEELNNAYLVIGRNRRQEDGTDISPVKGRLVTGKKGLGKLAVFGVANIIEVSSVSGGKINIFRMKYSDIRATTDGNSGYRPEIIEEEQATEESTGTVITISEVGTKSLPSLHDLSISLSKRFKFFNETDFKVVLKDAESGEEIEVKNEVFYNSME